MEEDMPIEYMEDIEEVEEGDIVLSRVRLTKGEIYIILLKDDGIAKVYNVSSIDSDENTVTMTDSSNKSHIFEIEDYVFILSSKKLDYEIIDIERVIPFDLSVLKQDKEQLDKLLTSDIIKGLDISLDEILEKDIVYTDTELREELLSSLVNTLDAYDKLNKIDDINSYIDEIFLILHEDKDYIDNTIPRWIIPIVDNPIKIHKDIVDTETGEDKNESIEMINLLSELSNSEINNYYQIYHNLLDILRPINPSLSEIGYTTNIVKNYLRDCLTDSSCLGYNGNYVFDKRCNKQSYVVNNKIFHKSDMLNIVGLLYIPDDHLIQCLDVDTINHNLTYKILFQKIITDRYYNIINLRKKTIISKLINQVDMSKESLVNIISYTFTERLNITKFYDYIKKITPSIELLLTTIDERLTTKLLNYDDIRLLLIKYNINIEKLSKESKRYISKLLNTNSKEYINSIVRIPRIILKYNKHDLDIKYKIEKSKDIIFSMNSISKRNEYLQLFIQSFTREPTHKEDKNYLYNIYTNEPLICKHYLYSSVYHRDKNAHSTMISIYGKSPIDGIIYCKHCGEYLCEEDFSSFDGFVNETPIQLREVMKTDINLLEGFTEEDILLVKQISGCLGITLKEEDILFILSNHKNLNQDKLVNIRYDSESITTSHPIISDIKKKYSKDKHKKELIKEEMKKLQIFFKNTNKIISYISLILLTVQTSIPCYKNKHNINLNFIEFKDATLDSLSYDKKVIDYYIIKLNKLAGSQSDIIWLNYKQLESEEKVYDLATLQNQIYNLVRYLISPQFNIIQERIINYIKFITTVSYKYIKDEWVLYKPLRKNRDISKIDEYIHSLDPKFKQYYILNYNNYPIENVSILESLVNSSKLYIKELVNIPTSEIMINKSFLLIFKLALSGYGVYKGNSKRIYLHIDRFINTIKHKDIITDIFTRHGYTKQKHISYKLLRTKIIPDIINHYQKDKLLLEIYP
jgi:hypothetical protein